MKDNYIKKLINKGLLNHTSEDYGSFVTAIGHRYRAYCTSARCAKSRVKVHIDNVKQHDEYCPQCGHALLWKRDKEQ